MPCQQVYPLGQFSDGQNKKNNFLTQFNIIGIIFHLLTKSKLKPVAQSSPLACLQDLSMSDRLWQYERSVLRSMHCPKFWISVWQGFCWLCTCCWGACCCWTCWCELFPITPRTAWWATSEPAPKAMPCMMVLPMPPNIPDLCAVCGCCMGACGAGCGLDAANELLGGGDDDLEPPLDPPLGITIQKQYSHMYANTFKLKISIGFPQTSLSRTQLIIFQKRSMLMGLAINRPSSLSCSTLRSSLAMAMIQRTTFLSLPLTRSGSRQKLSLSSSISSMMSLQISEVKLSFYQRFMQFPDFQIARLQIFLRLSAIWRFYRNNSFRRVQPFLLFMKFLSYLFFWEGSFVPGSIQKNKVFRQKRALKSFSLHRQYFLQVKNISYYQSQVFQQFSVISVAQLATMLSSSIQFSITMQPSSSEPPQKSSGLLAFLILLIGKKMEFLRLLFRLLILLRLPLILLRLLLILLALLMLLILPRLFRLLAGEILDWLRFVLLWEDSYYSGIGLGQGSQRGFDWGLLGSGQGLLKWLGLELKFRFIIELLDRDEGLVYFYLAYSALMSLQGYTQGEAQGFEDALVRLVSWVTLVPFSTLLAFR